MILEQVKAVQPDLLIDGLCADDANGKRGILTWQCDAIRECATALLKYAKDNNVPVLLIGHITKEGSIAGPKVLEHIVDCVLQFEGDRHYFYRILRSIKNRFGSTAEIGHL